MSIEDLQADIDRNTTDLQQRPLLTLEDVKALMMDTMFPLLKSVANELEEIDDDLSDYVQHADSILQAEDAALFSEIIKMGVMFAEALDKRLKADETGNKWRKKIRQFMELVQTGAARLMEITVVESEDDAEPDADADDAPPEGKPNLTSIPPPTAANDQEAK